MGPPRFRVLDQPQRRSIIEETKPWPEKYAPETLTQVCMHPTKLRDIQQAITSSVPLVVVTGPAGSSKSTAIRCTARSEELRLVEFTAPEDGQINALHDFLTGARMQPPSTLILIDDIPNVFHEDTRRAFEQVLHDWVDRSDPKSAHKLIVVFTEVEQTIQYQNSGTVERIFGSALARSRHIRTNSIYSKLLLRVLDQVASMEGLQVPKNMLAELATCGDVRSALNALEFWAKDPDAGPHIQARGAVTGFFPAVARVVHTSSQGLEAVAEGINAYADNPGSFDLAVFENYTKARKSRLPLWLAAECILALSDGDLDLPDASLVVATLLHNNPDEVDSQIAGHFKQIEGSKWFQWHRRQLSSSDELARACQRFRLSHAELIECRALGLEPQDVTAAFPDQVLDTSSSEEGDDDARIWSDSAIGSNQGDESSSDFGMGPATSFAGRGNDTEHSDSSDFGLH